MDRYKIAYERCGACGFMQTEEPFWLAEAYAEPLSASDTGLVSRPLALAPRIESIIRRGFDPNGRFLDYGGGPGLFVRLMRDRGFNFYRQDRYAAPILCRYFDLEDLPVQERRFALVTAFELMEHLPRPLIEISEMLSLTDSVLFSTELVPSGSISNLETWWYLGLAHGQHVSFYTGNSLSALASSVGCHYFPLDANLHFITRLGDIQERLDRDPDMRDLVSLTLLDMEYVLSCIRKIDPARH
jgi:hypothetical protein